MNCHGWGASTSWFFLSCFLSVNNLGQRDKKGSDHLQLPCYNEQRLGITALHNVHWTLDNPLYNTSGSSPAAFNNNPRERGRELSAGRFSKGSCFRELWDRSQMEKVVEGATLQSHNCRLHKMQKILPNICPVSYFFPKQLLMAKVQDNTMG